MIRFQLYRLYQGQRVVVGAGVGVTTGAGAPLPIVVTVVVVTLVPGATLAVVLGPIVWVVTLADFAAGAVLGAAGFCAFGGAEGTGVHFIAEAGSLAGAAVGIAIAGAFAPFAMFAGSGA